MIRAYCFGLSVTLALVPVAAEAHAFKTGSAYPQFVEGVGVTISCPPLLLTLIPLGILVGLRQLDGMVRVWPALIVGMLAGQFLAPLVGPVIIAVALALGVLCAILAAVNARYPNAPMRVLSASAGVMAAMVMLEGHAFGELPIAVYLGLFAGANLVVGMVAGLARLGLERYQKPFVRLGAFVAASWVGAIAILLLALTLRG